MEDDIKIKCSITLNNKKETWQASLKSITNYENYYEASIEARSTHFNMLVGHTDSYNWVALPIQEVSCSLASLDDIFWNEERLSNLIGAIDATTIVSTIAFIDRHKDILLDNSTMTKNSDYRKR
ncbi:hypothetical protein [Thomasclavelia cocleata]|uniref:hypothetical protein n=1 Tax=Thomasclavelia cocleata TaxID=69824 RepID=UPI0025710431|nr:hypothetical protein [Thomasclavelia cocleata]